MTAKQKASVWLAVLLVVAASLFPPWTNVNTYILGDADVERLYGIITSMEARGESRESIQSAVGNFKQGHGRPASPCRWLFSAASVGTRKARVDLPRLFVEWIIAMAIAAGLYFAWPTIALSPPKTINWPRITKRHLEIICAIVTTLLVGLAVLAFLGYRVWSIIQKKDWLLLGLFSAFLLFLGWKESRKSGG